MVNLKWDGDVDSEDVDSEISEVNQKLSQNNMETDNVEDTSDEENTRESSDVSSSSTVETDDKLERLNELADGEDSEKCLHEWKNVSREEMTRMVNGEVIDSKDVYWCNTCKSILDTITS